MRNKLICMLAAFCLLGCAANTNNGKAEETAAPEASAAPSAEASAAPEESAAPETAAPSAAAEEELEMATDFSPIDFSDQANWLWYGEESGKTAADIFILPGSVFAEPVGNVAVNEATFRRQQALTNRMKGMGGKYCTIYSPVRRQATMVSYAEENAEEYKDKEYQDAADAFAYYVENVHTAGRPLVIMGFSSGGMCALRLLEDYFAPDTPEAKALRDDLAAAYLISWGVPASTYEKYPNLKAAKGEEDTGVIISFEPEFPEVTDSIVLHKDETYVAINPLNWATDSRPAGKEENEGAVLVNAKGEIKMEADEFCGAYLDETSRHALKVTDIDPADFPTTLSVFPQGSLHEYSIMLFYRNIEENVDDRIEEWYEQRGVEIDD